MTVSSTGNCDRICLEQSFTAFPVNTAVGEMLTGGAGHGRAEGITIALVALDDLVLGAVICIAVVDVIVKGDWDN